MNKSNKIYKAAMALALSAGLALTACDDDKDMFQVGYPSASEIASQGNDIICSESNLEQAGIILSYTIDGVLQLNGNGDVSHNMGKGYYVIETSADQNFSRIHSIEMDTEKGSVAISKLELSIIAKNLGLEAGKMNTIYIRVNHKFNTESAIEGTYSNIVSVNVNPIYIDMHYLLINLVEGKRTDTLYSAGEDMIYKGFLPFESDWAHWYGRDGQFRYVGNETVNWSYSAGAFYTTSQYEEITAGGNNFNFWTFGGNGCTYVTVDTKKAEDITVTYELIRSLKAEGDITADFAFNSAKSQFVAFVESAKDDAKFTVSGESAIYTKSGGDKSPTPGTFKLGAKAGGTLEIGTDGAFTLGKAGSYKIVIDLNNPEKPTYSIGQSSAPVFPKAVKAVCGGDEADLSVDIVDGAANGKCLGIINVSQAGKITLKGDNGKEYLSADAAKAGTYAIKADLSAGTISAALLSSSLTMLDKDDNSIVVATFPAKLDAGGNPTGIYQGPVTTKSDYYKFNLVDANGTPWGSNGWTKDGLAYNNGDNFWFEGADGSTYATGSYVVTFDALHGVWSAAPIAFAEVKLFSKDGADLGVSLTLKDGVYVGEYTPVDNWNFYFVAEQDGAQIIYGCDDDCTGQSDPINRSLLIGSEPRKFGDGKSQWLDPGNGTYIITADFASGTWDAVVKQ